MWDFIKAMILTILVLGIMVIFPFLIILLFAVVILFVIWFIIKVIKHEE